MFRIIFSVLVFISLARGNIAAQSAVEIRKFKVNEAKQAVAVDNRFFYVHTMQHVGTHSFGIAEHGSLTWIDQKDGSWWIGFAHYGGKEASEGRDVRWTSLVRYDLSWRQVESWIFPKDIVALFTPKSNSGGVWGNDGLLYCTGHDRPELYVMKLPASGYTLEHLRTIPAEIYGQGIAADHSVKNKLILYGINRAAGTVTVSEIRP
jgi:hypothetical protein